MKTYATDNIACSAFSEISYSRNDTAETIRQIVGHNASYKAICEEEN